MMTSLQNFFYFVGLYSVDPLFHRKLTFRKVPGSEKLCTRSISFSGFLFCSSTDHTCRLSYLLRSDRSRSALSLDNCDRPNSIRLTGVLFLKLDDNVRVDMQTRRN